MGTEIIRKAIEPITEILLTQGHGVNYKVTPERCSTGDGLLRVTDIRLGTTGMIIRQENIRSFALGLLAFIEQIEEAL